jgi:hypothetical protein
MAADWQSTLAKRFTTDELERITDFLRTINERPPRDLHIHKQAAREL